MTSCCEEERELALKGLFSSLFSSSLSAEDSQSSKIILSPEASILVLAALPSGASTEVSGAAEVSGALSFAAFSLPAVSSAGIFSVNWFLNCSAYSAISLLSDVNTTCEFFPVSILAFLFLSGLSLIISF